MLQESVMEELLLHNINLIFLSVVFTLSETEHDTVAACSIVQR